MRIATDLRMLSSIGSQRGTYTGLDSSKAHLYKQKGLVFAKIYSSFVSLSIGLSFFQPLKLLVIQPFDLLKEQKQKK